MFTDSHCHLVFPELQAQLPAIRDAMAAKDEAVQENVRKLRGLRVSLSIRDVRTKWETKGAHYLHRGYCWQALGQKQKARMDFEKAKKLGDQ